MAKDQNARGHHWGTVELYYENFMILDLACLRMITFIPRGNLESPINLHVFGLW